LPFKLYELNYERKGENFSDCVEQLEKAKIFNDSTLYKAEKYIELIFG